MQPEVFKLVIFRQRKENIKKRNAEIALWNKEKKNKKRKM